MKKDDDEIQKMLRLVLIGTFLLTALAVLGFFIIAILSGAGF